MINKVKVDLHHKYMVEHIINDFPFQYVQDIMKKTNWRYFGDVYNEPSLPTLIKTLRSLLETVRNCNFTGTGGFEVSYSNDTYTVSFIVSSFCYDSESNKWDDDDFNSYQNFIDKITPVLQDRPIWTETSIVNFFMKLCDDFIKSGRDFSEYDDIGVSLWVESEADCDKLYNVSVIGFKKTYT